MVTSPSLRHVGLGQRKLGAPSLVSPCAINQLHEQEAECKQSGWASAPLGARRASLGRWELQPALAGSLFPLVWWVQS